MPPRHASEAAFAYMRHYAFFLLCAVVCRFPAQPARNNNNKKVEWGGKGGNWREGRTEKQNDSIRGKKLGHVTAEPHAKKNEEIAFHVGNNITFF